MKVLVIICCLLCSFSIFSHEWQEVETSKLPLIFKQISWEKILASKNYKLEWRGEKMVSYSGCGEDFPELPGGFPCSFLSDEFSEGNGEVYPFDASGGKIALKISKENTKIGGKAFLISDEEEKDREEFLIRAFYRKDRFLSHYFYKNKLVIFRWEGKGQEKALTLIYIASFDSRGNITSFKRLKFS
jgi:hypothetical protein